MNERQKAELIGVIKIGLAAVAAVAATMVFESIKSKRNMDWTRVSNRAKQSGRIAAVVATIVGVLKTLGTANGAGPSSGAP